MFRRSSEVATQGIREGSENEQDGGKKAAEQTVIGTWKLVSARYGDQALDLTLLGTTLKHVTPTGFVWLSYDATTSVVSRTAEGTYTLKGDK